MTDISRHHRLRAEIEGLMPAMRSLAEAICRNPTDAEDLVQETVAATLASLDQFPERISLEWWMFATMYDSFRRKFEISE
ncbi:sigma factor [Rhizobium sp. BR 362]|uniref:sigma factor n=1 Tax=Rhizobium sp. BR 362 TaxID=3040670 RepID=UPI002F41B398